MTALPTATVVHTVTEADTAAALGSGDLPVLATPRVVAWCEAATCRALDTVLDLPPDRTSVGIRVALDHVAASAVGATITARAEVTEVDDRRATFTVSATDEHGTEVARGEVVRAVVERERFLARVPEVGD